MAKARLYKYSEYVRRPGDAPVRDMRSISHGDCWLVESKARNIRQNYIFLLKQVFAKAKGDPGIYAVYWIGRDDGYDDSINPFSEYPWEHRPLEGPFRGQPVLTK